jgi:single-strand DNA-binding protein
MANFLTIRGFVCSAVETRTTPNGLVVGHFRMGSTHRRQDPVTNAWSDGDTNWFRVNVFRALAQNSVSSIHKGDRIIVVGKLHMVNYMRKDGNPGISVEIDAESIGADLQFGTAFYARTGALRQNNESAASQYDAGSQGDGPKANAGEGGYYPTAAGRDDSDDTDPDGLNTTQRDTEEHESSEGRDEDDTDNDDGVEAGEVADRETGELVKDAAPF